MTDHKIRQTDVRFSPKHENITMRLQIERPQKREWIGMFFRGLTSRMWLESHVSEAHGLHRAPGRA